MNVFAETNTFIACMCTYTRKGYIDCVRHSLTSYKVFKPQEYAQKPDVAKAAPSHKAMPSSLDYGIRSTAHTVYRAKAEDDKRD